MWRRVRELLYGTRRNGDEDARPVGSGTSSAASAGTQRILKTVRSQLDAAGAPLFDQWRRHLGFVTGYVEALADLHASNAGHAAQGPHSRAISTAVLVALGSDTQLDPLDLDIAEPGLRSTLPYQLGRDTAMRDYDRWSEQEMSGIESFIDAAGTSPQAAHAQHALASLADE